MLNTRAQPWTGIEVLTDLSTVEVEGIPRGAVKCVEMWGNTSGEGALLGRN
jgi:hypothetical protein